MFINPDPDAEPLEDFLGEMAEQFEVWDLGNRYKQTHIAKIVPCNWKIAQEAFCEAYHVNATHPQILPYLGDINSQVDVWENFARVITPGGTASPLLDWTPDPGRDDAGDARRPRRPGLADHAHRGTDDARHRRRR